MSQLLLLGAGLLLLSLSYTESSDRALFTVVPATRAAPSGFLARPDSPMTFDVPQVHYPQPQSSWMPLFAGLFAGVAGFHLGSKKVATLAVEPTLSRRSFAAALVLAAPLQANAAEGAKAVWVPRKNAIEKPTSVTVSKCNVEKPCAGGATLWGPWADLGAQDPSNKKKKK